MATASKESCIKSGLIKFLDKHKLEANIELIDDVVLSYIISILEDLGDDSNEEDNIDVDQFIEMMEAYIPGFMTIDSIKVVEWMFELASVLSSKNTDDNANVSSAVNGDSLIRLDDGIQDIKDNKKEVVLNSNVDCESTDEIDEMVDSLLEMFPNACIMEVTHCLTLSHGDPEEAAQLILHREEMGDSIKPSPTKVREKAKFKTKAPVLDEKDIKDKVLERYSYVDEKLDKKTYVPVEPKQQPKKMIRYLDGKIVSTKGERYTELKKDDSEEMKKTYINLKPARKYRFH